MYPYIAGYTYVARESLKKNIGNVGLNPGRSISARRALHHSLIVDSEYICKLKKAQFWIISAFCIIRSFP